MRAGVLQSLGAQTELHCRSVCHRQERQRAHFPRGEHERQRAARPPQRYEDLEPWCDRLTHLKCHVKLSITGINDVATQNSCISITLKKIFLQTATRLSSYMGSDRTFLTLHYRCPSGIPFMQVEALDRDDLDTAHADLRFRLMEQTPRIPSSQMFSIGSITGEVSLTEEGQSQTVREENSATTSGFLMSLLNATNVWTSLVVANY